MSEVRPVAVVPVVRSVREVRARVRQWRNEGKTVALVPTMGALHAGHVSLVDLAVRQADRVVVSIFVNPMQFGPDEDLARYPRQEAADLALLEQAGAALLFAPAMAEVYPTGFATTVHVGDVGQGLCAVARPTHFDGVATVVAKLLNQVQPDIAVFGEKDYQQLLVIKRMVRDLDLPVTVLGAPLVRDADGLALSSRNAYLSAEQRARALALPRVLHALAADLADGRLAAPLLAEGIASLRAAGFDTVDYLELRDADDLAPLAHVDRPARVLAAARIGQTRLIDNIAVAPVAR
ncbi:MAG: pantoate--beta-alanine ligase [Sphingomonadales bacterium]